MLVLSRPAGLWAAANHIWGQMCSCFLEFLTKSNNLICTFFFRNVWGKQNRLISLVSQTFLKKNKNSMWKVLFVVFFFFCKSPRKLLLSFLRHLYPSVSTVGLDGMVVDFCSLRSVSCRSEGDTWAISWVKTMTGSVQLRNCYHSVNVSRHFIKKKLTHS